MMDFYPPRLFLKEIMGKWIVVSKNVHVINVSVYIGMLYSLLKKHIFADHLPMFLKLYFPPY